MPGHVRDALRSIKTRLIPFAVLATLAGGCRDYDPVAPFAPTEPQSITAVGEPTALYEQPATASLSFSGCGTAECWYADDFVVPAGETWQITHVELTGLYSATFTDTALDLRIYAMGAGKPGTVLHDFPALYPTRTPDETFPGQSEHFLMLLPSTITLSAGTYWLGVGVGGSRLSVRTSALVGSRLVYELAPGSGWFVSPYDDGLAFSLFTTVVALLTPTFSFDLSALPAKTYGEESFSVAGFASTNSSGAITFATAVGSVGCWVTEAGEVTITGAATGTDQCVLEAILAADATYAAAGPLTQGFSISKAVGLVAIANIPTGATVGGSFTPTYTTVGDGTASAVSQTPSICTVAAGVVSFIAAGTCTLLPSLGEGANYAAATGDAQSFTIVAPPPVFSSACTYVVNSKTGQRAVSVSWANATPGVTLIRVTDGRTVEKRISPAASGSWTTTVKSGVPAYELRGGATRRDSGTVLVPAGTACSTS